MSFQDEVESLVGSVPSGAELEAALIAGAEDVVRRVTLTTPDDLWLFTKEIDIPLAGIAIDSGKIYDVNYGKRPCKVIPPSLRHQAAENDSIWFATAEFPVYYLVDGKIKVLPAPNTGTYVNKTIDATADGDNATGFATYNGGTQTLISITAAAAHGLVAGQFIEIIQNTSGSDTSYVGIYEIIATAGTPVSYQLIINRNFTAVTTATFGEYAVSISEASANVLQSHVITAAGTTIDNFPSTYYRFPVLYAAMSVTLKKMADLHTSLPQLILPVSATPPEIETTSESLPTYNVPSALILPAPPEGVDIDFSGIGDPPLIESVATAVLPVLAFDVSDIVITGLEITPSPIPPVAFDGSDGIIDFATLVRSKIPSYTKPVFSSPSFPTIVDLDLPEAPVPPSVNSLTGIDLTVASTDGNHPALTMPAIGDISYTRIDSYIETEEDVELASAKLQKIQAQIGEYQAKLSAEQISFNREMEIYKAKIQEELQEVQTKLNKENQQIQSDIAIFGAQTQIYQIDINSKISEWTKNNIELKYTKWIQEFEKGLAQYQADMANNMNDFNRQTAEYQAEIAKVTADSSNIIASESNRFQRQLQSYQGDLEIWKIKVNDDVTQWQTTVVQPVMTKFSQIRGENMAEWQTQTSSTLSLLQSDLASAKQKNDADMSRWQALIGKASSTFTAETGLDITKYQAEVAAAAQRYQLDAAKAMDEHKAKLEKFTAEYTRVSAINSDRASNYQSVMTEYTATSQTKLNEYTSTVQTSGVEYKWLSDKYVMLKQEYSDGFIVKPQPQEGAR